MGKVGECFIALCVSGILGTGCAGGRSAMNDRPVTLRRGELVDFDAAIAPYVARARAELPEVKRRFQAGLAPGEELFVTVRIGRAGRFEQVYVRVDDWYGGDVLGRLSNRVKMPLGFAQGETVSFKESEILDWTLVGSDGRESGNYVGRFLSGRGAR